MINLKQYILESRPYTLLKEWLSNVILPGFDGLSIWEVLTFFVQGITKGSIITRASAISFKIILAIAPSFILLLTLIPYIPIDNFQENLLDGIEQLIPGQTYELVESTLNELIIRKHNTFMSISFVLGVYYASNSIHALLQGLKESHFLEKKQNPFSQRISSIILSLVLPLFLGSAFLVQTLSETVLNWMLEKKLIIEGIQVFLLQSAKWMAVLMLLVLGISTLYNIAIPKRKKWQIFNAGVLVASIGVIVISQAFAYYVNNFGQFSKLYGSLATVIILLLWIYFNNIILLIGFELKISVLYAQKKRLAQS